MVQSANPGDYDTALGFLRRAVELDPDYALATAFLAWVLEKRLTLNLASAGPGDRDEAVALARRAIAIGGDNPTVLVLGAWILIVFHVDWDAGLAAARRAYAANPNDLMILNMAGTCELLGGDLLASRALHSRAVALAPNSPDRYLDLTGVADTYLHDGDYEQALEWAQRSLQTFNDWPITFWNLTASSAHLGRMEQARQYLDRLLELAPGLTLSHFEALQMRDRVRWAHLTDGLRKAGLA